MAKQKKETPTELSQLSDTELFLKAQEVKASQSAIRFSQSYTKVQLADED